MANQNQVWTLGINVGGAIQGIGQLVQAIGLQKSALNDMTISMVKYNSVQKNFEATIKGTTDKGDNVSARARIDATTGRLKKVLGYQITPQKPDDALDDEGGINFNRLAQVTLFRTAIHAMINEIRTGTEEAIKFQTEISQIRIAAVNTTSSFNEWAGSVRKVSDEFGQSQTDVAQASIKALGTQLVQTRGQTENFVGVASQFAEITGGTATQGVEVLGAAIKAFGQDVNNAQDIAGKLHVTMQLTGASSTELASSFGKVGPLANSMGLTFEELNATLTTLTQRGVSFGEASTFLTELLTKMAKPSKELKELFNQWGVASGEAAFKTFGYAETIRKLSEAAKGAVPELAQMFDSVHGLKGAAGVTLFKDFDENLDRVKNSAEEYKKAAQTIIESPGKQIQIELNKIKNFFVDELGSETLGVINSVTKELGGLANVVKSIISVVQPMLLVWTNYKAGMVLASVTTVSFTGATTGLKAAIGSINPVAAAFTVAFTAMYYIMQKSGNEALRTSANFQRLVEEGKKASQIKFIDQTDLTQYTEGVDSVFRAVDQILANSFKNADSRLKTMSETTRQLGGDLENNFKSALGAINEGIGELKRRISEAQTEINNSFKSTTDFKRSLEDIIRSSQKEFATPQQRIGFNAQYIRELEEEIKRGYSTGDKEEVESARHKFTEIAKLYEENFKTSVEIAKQSGQRIAVTVGPLKYALEGVQNFRQAMEEQYRANLNKTIKTLDDLDAKQQQRVKQLEQAVKKFTDLQNAITEGKINKDDPKYKAFFDKDGKLDTGKLQKALERQASLIVAVHGQAGADLVKIYEGVNAKILSTQKQAGEQNALLQKNLSTQTANLIKTETLEVIKFQIEETRKANETNKAEAIKAAKDLNTARGNFGTTLSEGLNQAKGDLTDLENAVKNISTSIFNVSLGGEQRKNLIFDKEQTLKDIDFLKNKLTELQATSPKNPEQLKALQEQITGTLQQLGVLKTRLNQLAKDQTGNPNANIFNTGLQREDGAAKTTAAILDDLERKIKEAGKAGQNVSQLEAKLTSLKADLDSVFNGPNTDLQQQLLLTLAAGDNAELKLKNNFKGVAESLADATKQAKEFNQTVNDMVLRGIELKVDVNGPIKPVAQATGGYLYGPRGADNIPAWLTKGEFVMNSAATGMYRPILEAMNQSKRPGYYASGGYVTTNVGDININMTSTGRAETDVRRIGNLLRREIKRGNVTLR